jgi:hypothetical protein
MKLLNGIILRTSDPFQAIAQSVGTIDDQEADPTGDSVYLFHGIFRILFGRCCLWDNNFRNNWVLLILPKPQIRI